MTDVSLHVQAIIENLPATNQKLAKIREATAQDPIYFRRLFST